MSSNDTMVQELSEHIEGFESDQQRIRCFLHIINLVAKKLLRMLDVPKRAEEDAKEDDLLQRLANGLDSEELQATVEALRKAAVSEDEDKDDLLWLDEFVDDSLDMLTASERVNLEAQIRPLRMVLVKVRMRGASISFTLQYSMFSYPSASQARIQDHLFHDEVAAAMEIHCRRLEDGG